MYAQICTHMHNYAQVCTRMHTYKQIRTHMHAYAHVCTYMHKYAQICTRMHTCAQISNPSSSRCACHVFVPSVIVAVIAKSFAIVIVNRLLRRMIPLFAILVKVFQHSNDVGIFVLPMICVRWFPRAPRPHQEPLKNPPHQGSTKNRGRIHRAKAAQRILEESAAPRPHQESLKNPPHQDRTLELI